MSDRESPFVVDSNAVEQIEVKAGTAAAMQILIGADRAPHFAMRRFIMQPGGGMPEHTNTVEHEQFVLRGFAEVGIGGDVYRVKAGDVVYIPKSVPHWYKASSNEPFEFLCVVPNLPDKIELAGASGASSAAC
jgi:quercetin dioxygenase-like cupin family protein